MSESIIMLFRLERNSQGYFETIIPDGTRWLSTTAEVYLWSLYRETKRMLAKTNQRLDDRAKGQ